MEEAAEYIRVGNSVSRTGAEEDALGEGGVGKEL
jgi:hypothetical protein